MIMMPPIHDKYADICDTKTDARSESDTMKKQELELVAHEILPGLRMYVTQLKYCELHLHIDAELCLVLDGRGKLHTIQKDTQIKRGEFFYFNSLEAHEVTAASDKILIFGVQYSPVILNICDPKLTRLRVNEMTPSASLKKAGESMTRLSV